MSTADGPLTPELLRSVFDSLCAGVFVADETGRVIASTPYAQQLIDRPREQIVGLDLHDLLQHPTEADGKAPPGRCRVLSVLETGRPEEGDSEFLLRGDGTLLPIIWAASPLHHNGGVQGLVVVFHDFSHHRQSVAETKANLAAQEELTARLSLISGVSAALSSKSQTTSEILDRLVELLAPQMGDWAVIDLRTSGTDEMQRVAVHVPGDPEASESLKGPLPPLPVSSHSALVRALRGNRPLILNPQALAQEPDTPLAMAHRELFDRLGGQSAVVAPLYTRRQVFGVLTVARTGSRSSYTETDAQLLADIARRTGLVLEDTEVADQRLHEAETMQRQLLTPLPQVDHLYMAARYQPAQEAAEVGGDWYDSFLLSDGVLTMVIGDVVGHDLQAAAHMAEVRNMLRALAWDRQEPPSSVLSRLDDVMTHTSDAPMATAVFARLEGPEGGPWQLHWANAGHPPPLLITADGYARYLESGQDQLLGLSAALGLGLKWNDVRADLPPRSTVLLYTDGLVESRDHQLGEGLAKLRRHAAALARRDVDDFLDELLRRVAPGGEDDVALLALRLPPAGVGGPGDRPAPHQHTHNPAAATRHAPGSLVEGTPVRDASKGPE